VEDIAEWNDAIEAKYQAHQVEIGKRKPPTYRQLSLELWGQIFSAAIEANPTLLGPEGSSQADE
jgi:hypothetical protein